MSIRTKEPIFQRWYFIEQVLSKHIKISQLDYISSEQEEEEVGEWEALEKRKENGMLENHHLSRQMLMLDNFWVFLLRSKVKQYIPHR
jgi:hypothetical protein